MSNINAQSCSNFCNSYPTVSSNHCLRFAHLWLWMGIFTVCINNTGSAAFKNIDPLIHTSLWQTVLPILINQLSMDLPLLFLQTLKRAILHTACPWCKPIVEHSSLHHARSAQTDSNRTTFTACHFLTLSYSMTGPKQCSQSYNENILFSLTFWLSFAYNRLALSLCEGGKCVNHICKLFNILALKWLENVWCVFKELKS
jgi:hypothetical protein